MFLVQKIEDIFSVFKLSELSCISAFQVDLNIDDYLKNGKFDFSKLNNIISHCKEDKLELFVKIDFDSSKLDRYKTLNKEIARKILEFVANFISKDFNIYVSFPFCITSLYVAKVMQRKSFHASIHNFSTILDAFLSIKSGASIVMICEDFLYKSGISVNEFSRELRIAVDNYPEIHAFVYVDSINSKNLDTFILSGIDYVSFNEF